MEYRIEKDSIGEKQVPVDAYYGVQSMRGCENFHITGQRMQPEFIDSMAEIKKACAICNCQVGELDAKIRDAIAVKEAQISQESLFKYAPKSNVAKDYEGFVNEFLGKERSKKNG